MTLAVSQVLCTFHLMLIKLLLNSLCFSPYWFFRSLSFLVHDIIFLKLKAILKLGVKDSNTSL